MNASAEAREPGKSVLAVNGSPRRGGNTARVLDILSERLEGMGVSVDRLELSRAHVEPCRGCRLCFDRGEDACPLEDDVLSIRNRILDAGAMVLATPVYVNDVSGTMKNLIDRLAFVCHRPAFTTTPVAVVATTGGTPARHALRTLEVAVLSWGSQTVARAAFATGALSSLEEIAGRYAGELAKTAGRLRAAVVNPPHRRPSFVSLMTFAIQQSSWREIAETEGGDTLDARYWRENGWFDRATTYYVRHAASAAKTGAARSVGRVVARLFG